MTRKVLVIGAGQFGSGLALELVEQGADVTVLDPREERISGLAARVAQVNVGSATDVRVLRGLDVESYDEVVNAIGEESLEASILTTQLLTECGARRIVARVVSDLHERIVRALGAKSTISTIHPEQHTARYLARKIVRPEVKSELELAEGAKLIELEVPEKWVGKTLLDLGLRADFGVTVVAVRTGADGARRLVTSPPPDVPLIRGDEMMLIGPPENAGRVLKELS